MTSLRCFSTLAPFVLMISCKDRGYNNANTEAVTERETAQQIIITGEDAQDIVIQNAPGYRAEVPFTDGGSTYLYPKENSPCSFISIKTTLLEASLKNWFGKKQLRGIVACGFDNVWMTGIFYKKGIVNELVLDKNDHMFVPQANGRVVEIYCPLSLKYQQQDGTLTQVFFERANCKSENIRSQ